MTVPCLIKLLGDPAWDMYFASIVISGFAFLLFIWWWLQVRKVSEVYYYLTFMLGANTVSDMTALYSRTLYLLEHDAFLHFSSSPMWWVRRLPETICIFLIICRMMQRLKRIMNEANHVNDL